MSGLQYVCDQHWVKAVGFHFKEKKRSCCIDDIALNVQVHLLCFGFQLSCYHLGKASNASKKPKRAFCFYKLSSDICWKNSRCLQFFLLLLFFSYIFVKRTLAGYKNKAFFRLLTSIIYLAAPPPLHNINLSMLFLVFVRPHNDDRQTRNAATILFFLCFSWRDVGLWHPPTPKL